MKIIKIFEVEKTIELTFCFHNLDGPAVANNMVKYWLKNNKIHRDGNKPAIIFSNGNKEWWENNEFIKDN